MSVYDQIDFDGEIAWTATAEGTLSGEQIHFRMIIAPDENARFIVKRVEATGAPRGGYLFIDPELLPP